ncbi:MAG: PilZ domain-containing protein [Planctomycetota bacterium]|nr:PilZ domain-containing protein [Planctomycetota bacterium]
MPEQAVTASAPAPAPPLFTRKRVGAMLVQMGKLTPQQAEEAAAMARASGERLGQYLVRNGKISAGALCRALALQSGLPMTDLADVDISEKLARLFPYGLMARHGFVPFDDAGSFICIAVANPLAPAAIKELQEACHRKVEIFLAREDVILKRLTALRPKPEAVPRKHLRYDVSLPVSYQFCTRLGVATDDTCYNGLALNISEGGFSVEGPVANIGKPEDLLRVGTCVRLTMAPDTPQQLSALCRLKIIQPKGPFWMMGLELADASIEDRRRLKELCVRAMLGKLKPPDTAL